MRKIHGLTVLALLTSTAAWSMKFSAPINQLKLPIIMSTEQPPAIKYTPPGKISVSALRMCGDGDVAHFAGEHPAFDFVPHENANLDVVVGYWVVDDSSTDASSVLPSATNWYPIAYQKIAIAESTSGLAPNGKFIPISHAAVASNSNVMDLIKSDLVNLHDTALQSYQSTKSYRIFAGAFACVDPDEASELTAEGVTDYSPSPIETVQSLKELVAEVNNSMSSMNLNNLLNTNKKVSISLRAENQRNLGQTSAPKPYKFEIGNQGEELSGTMFNTYKNILEAVYPATATTVEEYVTAMSALSWYGSISSGINGDKIAYCNAQGATSDKIAKTYKFEAFPLNLTCKNLFGGSDLVNSFNNLFNPATLPSATDFLAAQKDLAKRFLMGAAFQIVQAKLDVDAKVARSGCVSKKSGQNLIGRLVASYPLNFSFTSSDPVYNIKANSSNHIHPESLFAISDYTNYFAHDALAIWGQVTPNQGPSDAASIKAKGILLPLGDKTELNTHKIWQGSFGAPININFKVRSVGGSCTIYC